MAGLTELSEHFFLSRLGVTRSKFDSFKKRYGKVNEHNAMVPRDFWIEPHERQAIVEFHAKNPLEGYRRLTFMMLDTNVAAVSPATTYRVLRGAGLLDKNTKTPSKKGTGFVQPDAAHKHWHVDISYINIMGTFYYQCSLLDGYSRNIVHWEIHESMTEQQVEIVVERAKEKYPNAKPKIISDNGPQFIAKDFKEFLRQSEMTHARISPGYPQSNGKIERWHKTLKEESIRVTPPKSLEDARKIVERFVNHYNGVRLHSAIGYITPQDYLDGKEKQIWQDRDTKLEKAREERRIKRQKGVDP